MGMHGAWGGGGGSGVRNHVVICFIHAVHVENFNFLSSLCDQTTVNKKALIHYIIPINDTVHRPL